MSLSDAVKKIFGRKENEASGPSLVDEIKRHMELLVEKSGNLNESYGTEKEKIKSIAAEAASIKESKEILAAKLEQDILGRITAASSACELAIAEKTGSENVRKEIDSLQAKINQRSALK